MTTPSQQATVQVPQYVYGVTRSGITLPGALTGLDDRPVGLIEHERCAALTSDLPQGRPLGERADLLAHEQVLETLMNAGVVVLPFRFGAALSGADAVHKELLAANDDRLAQVLEQLDGRLELRFKGTYVQENVLREVLTDEPEIGELAARLREVPEDAEDAAYYERIRLGELIAQALQRRREDDARILLDALAPAAEAMVRKTPAREEDVVDAAFLIDQSRRAEFEQAAEDLGKAHGDRIRLRLIGPLPPYDFVPEA